jgi:hypothetical protein
MAFGDHAAQKIHQAETGEAPGAISSFGQDSRGNLCAICSDGYTYKLNL